MKNYFEYLVVQTKGEKNPQKRFKNLYVGKLLFILKNISPETTIHFLDACIVHISFQVCNSWEYDNLFNTDNWIFPFLEDKPSFELKQQISRFEGRETVWFSGENLILSDHTLKFD